MTSRVPKLGRHALVWSAVFAITASFGIAVAPWERGQAEKGLLLFSPQRPGCEIFVPAEATDGERRAAQTLQATLAKSAGRTVDDFPILAEGGAKPRPGIWVGDTRRGRRFMRTELKPPFDTGVGYVVEGGALVLKGERREGIESAASWFLEQTLGAQWFIPGSLGEHIPRRTELALSEGSRTARPGFLHRDLHFLDWNAESQAWYGRNRLETRFEHQHNLVNIFRPADFRRSPEMAPIRNGQQYIPSEKAATGSRIS
jgi:hypothetical protein